MLGYLPERRLQHRLQQRDLMLGEPFEVMSGIPVLARIPLMPATGREPSSTGDLLVAEGMFLASRAVDGGASSRDDRLRDTVRAYELRARFRPTPHGVFAGAAIASLNGGDSELRLGGGHRARTYPHPEWLAAFADEALERPEVLRGLRLTTSNLVVRRGDRLECEQGAVPDVAGPQLVSVRATAATLLILTVCESGTSYDTITAEVTRAWPQVPQDVIHSTVLTLVRAGFLLTDLLPESDDQDPLAHVIARLSATPSMRRPLEHLREHLRAADRCPPGAPERIAILSAARQVCDDVTEVSLPLSADVAVDARVTIPEALARQAAEAAGILWRISQGTDPLASYHRRFLDRYGPDRFVPLCEVVDPAVGLGVPGEHTVGMPGSVRADRAAILAGLIREASASGRIDIELSEADITGLDRHPADLPPPPTAEIYARVLTVPDSGMGNGRLSLAVYGGGNQQAGSTAGRLVGLLPGITTVTGTYSGADMEGEVLVAEVVVRPRTPRLAGIVPPSGSHGPRIPVGVPSRPGDMDLGHLLLGSVAGRLVLWSAEHDRPVLPVLLSRIGSLYMPPVARLLAELSAHGCRPWHGWSWQPLQRSPFQPRITYKQTIISPARWRLPADLVDAAHDRSRWGPALTAWRATTVSAPPGMVVIEDADRHLPLDLRDETDRRLLRRYVGRGITAVTELPGGHASAGAVIEGPAGRHVLELVIPLRRRTLHASAPTKVPRQARPRPLGHSLYLPGSAWLSVAIPCPPSCQEQILSVLGDVAQEAAGLVDRWFWLRYRNDAHGPHLRARFHGDPGSLTATVLPALAQRCADLIGRRLASGLYVEPYDQEIERYGGDQAIGLAEAVFSADSSVVLTTLAETHDTGARIVIAALSAASIALAVADGSRTAVDAGGLDRPMRRRATQLRPLTRKAAQTGPGTLIPAVASPWQDRDVALKAYRDAVPEERRPDCASSLIHMHANRLLGDLASERLARALAADLLARPRP